MKTLLVLLALVSVALAGHIFVEDPQLKWQNKNKFTTAILRISLESGLGANNAIRVEWPFDWTWGTCQVKQGSSTVAPLTGTGACSVTGSTNQYYVSVGKALAKNTWYEITLVGSGTAPTQKVYENPIKLETVSQGSGNYLVFDENHSAGIIAFSDVAAELGGLQVSHLKNKVEAPKDKSDYQALEKQYTIYVDVKPANDYMGGAFLKYKSSDSAFTLTGSCASEANTCAAPGTANYQSTCVNTTLDTGACTGVATGTDAGTYTFEHKGAMTKDKWYRIKVDVKNTHMYSTATGGVEVWMYSRKSGVYFYYEKKDSSLGTQFSLAKLAATDKTVTYFWGLAAHDAASWGCPIGLFTDSQANDQTGGSEKAGHTALLKMWNKVTVYTSVTTAFPTSTLAQYKVEIAAPQAAAIPIGSINTNLPIYTGKKLTCSTSGSGASVKVVCVNLGNAAAQIYWVTFTMNIAFANAGALSGFGATQFFQRLASVAESSGAYTDITPATSGHSLTALAQDEFIGPYGSTSAFTDVIGVGPQVLNFAEPSTKDKSNFDTEIAKFIKTGNAAGTSAILLPSDLTTDLIFLLSPKLDQLCCGKTTAAYGFALHCASASGQCKAPTSDEKKDVILMKIIANPNAIDFTPTNFANKGVRVPPTGLFGYADTMCTAAQGCARYPDTAGDIKDLATQTASGHAWLNIWQSETGATVSDVKTSSYYHLSFTCADIRDCTTGTVAADEKMCTVTTDAAAAAYPAVTWPSVKFQSTFGGSPLYPNKYELDFIVCFRYKAGAGLTAHGFAITGTKNENSLASYGVLHAQTFWKDFDANTVFRVAIVNIARNTAFNDMSVVPMMLRVGGVIKAVDLTANEGAAMFLDNALVLGSTRKIATADVAKCASGTDSGITCEEWDSPESSKTYFYYPVMRRIVFKKEIKADTEFNHYIPVEFKDYAAGDKLAGMNMALVKADGNSYTPVKTYKTFGFAQGNQLNIFYTATTEATNWPAMTADAQGLVGALGTKSTLAVSSTPGLKCDFADQKTNIAKLYGGYSVATGSTVDVATKLAVATGGTAGTHCVMKEGGNGVTAEADDDNKNRVYGGAWGTHFTLLNVWGKFWAGSSKFDWSFGNAASTKKENKCFEFSYKLSDANDDKRARNLIVCPADYDGSTAKSFTDATGKLKLDSFKLPFYVGTAAADAATGLKNVMGYIWANQYGAALAYKTEQSQTYAMGEGSGGDTGSKCVVSADSTVWDKEGVAQKVTFKTKVTQSIVLDATVTNMKIKQDFNSAPAAFSANVGTKCLATGLSCVHDNQADPTFTLSLPSGTTTGTFTGDIDIYYWATTTATADTSTTFTGEIKTKNPATLDAQSDELVINVCDATANWHASTSPYGATVTNVKVNFGTLKQAMGNFEVKWDINKELWSFDTFTLTLGFIATAQSTVQGKNTKCNMYTGSGFDFDFVTSDDADLTSVALAMRDVGSANSYEYKSKKSFTFKCFGALNPNVALTASDNVKVSWTSGTEKAFGFDTDFKSGTTTAADRSPLETLTDPSLASNSSIYFTPSVTKTWIDPGMEAVYTFKVLLKAPISYDAGLWLLVEFPRAIAPKFNRKGAVQCQMGYNTTLTTTYCKCEGDRRLKILSNQKIFNDTVNPAGYKFIVHGVEQPKQFIQSYNKIYVAILSNTGSVMDYKTTPSGLEDPAMGTATPTQIQVLDYSVSTNYTRSTANFVLDLVLDANQVVADQEVYVQFPGEFCGGFFKGFSPSCTLNRQKDDWSGQETDNYVNNCTYVQGRKVKMFLKADAKNTVAKAYRLAINGVPTPDEPTAGYTIPTVMIPSAAGGTGVGKRTAPGFYNISFYSYGADSSKSYIEWEGMGVVETKIGVYDGKAALVPGGGKSAFLEDVTLTTSSAAFDFQPATFEITGGMKKYGFEFAPKSTTVPGLQFVEFTTNKATVFAPIKPLRVVVVSTKCRVTNDGSYVFPIGGTSLPYVIKFHGCKPQESVKLTLYAHNTSSNALTDVGKSFDSTNFTIDSDGTSKEFEVKQGGVPQVVFSVKSTAETVKAATVGKLLFVWTASPNQKSYEISTPIASVSSIAKVGIAAKLTLSVAKSAGKATLTYTCDQPSVFYYALATSNATLSGMTWSTIKAKSLDVGMEQSFPDGKNAHIVYGYSISRTASVSTPVDVMKVKSRATYNVYGVCVNIAQNVTADSEDNKNWTQTDNGGRPVTVNITYEKPLEAAVVKSSCKGYAIGTGIFCNRTICPDATNACDGSGLAISDAPPPAPATPTTPAPTTNATTNTTTRRRRRILQITDCLANITDCTACASADTCSTCNGTKLVAQNGKSCVDACPTGQVEKNGKCEIQSTKMAYYYVTMPDDFVGSDTTYADVEREVVTNYNTFKTVFDSKANLGGIKYDKPVLLPKVTGTLGTPTVSGNITVDGETAATFAASINGTDGFIYFGYAAGSQSKPTVMDFKQGKLSNGTFAKFMYAFVKNGKSISWEMTGLTAATQYTGLWMASNQDPVYGKTTDVVVEEFQTQGTVTPPTTFAANIHTTFLALLALLFALFILI